MTGNKKQNIAASLGNFLEWYDFALYGYFAHEIGLLFFTPLGKNALLASFGVFAAGFLSRPVGSYIFGLIGDRYGRKPALAIAFPMMFMATFMLGMLPTYQEIGIFAPILLILVRVFQGISVGGQYTGSITVLDEFSDLTCKARSLSLAWIFSNIGFITASFVCYMYLYFIKDEVPAYWQWRIPFLTSIFTVFMMSWRYHHLSETPSFLKLENTKESRKKLNPLQSIILFPRSFICSLILSATTLVSYNLIFVFLISFLTLHGGLSKKESILINGVGLVMQTLATPFVARLADAFGYKKINYIGSVCMLVILYPGFILFGLHDPWISLATVVLFGLASSTFYAPISALIVDAFPTQYRFSGTSMSYNIAGALFGGTTPMMCYFLMLHFNSPIVPGFYLIFWVMAGMLGTLCIRS